MTALPATYKPHGVRLLLTVLLDGEPVKKVTTRADLSAVIIHAAPDGKRVYSWHGSIAAALEVYNRLPAMLDRRAFEVCELEGAPCTPRL